MRPHGESGYNYFVCVHWDGWELGRVEWRGRLVGAGRGYWGIAASIPPPDLTYIYSSSLENRVIRPSEWLRYYPLLIRPSLNLTWLCNWHTVGRRATGTESPVGKTLSPSSHHSPGCRPCCKRGRATFHFRWKLTHSSDESGLRVRQDCEVRQLNHLNALTGRDGNCSLQPTKKSRGCFRSAAANVRKVRTLAAAAGKSRLQRWPKVVLGCVIMPNPGVGVVLHWQ